MTATVALTRAQRYLLGKVIMRQRAGTPTSETVYPSYAAAFHALDTEGLIVRDGDTYRLSVAGAREMLTWLPHARPVSAEVLTDYLRDTQEG